MNSTVLLETVELFHLYYTPILVYLGAIGNSLCIYVFQSPKLKKLSTSCYLSALAISDTVFLVALFIVWLTMVGVDVFNKSGSCQLIVYLTAVCSFLSAWFVVAFTVERFVAVRYPLLRSSICTVKRARIILTILSVSALALYAPMLVFADAIRASNIIANSTIANNTSISAANINEIYVCDVKPQWRNAAGVFNALDTIITFVVPVLVIVTLNIWISRTVRKLDSVRKRLTQRRSKILELKKCTSSSSSNSANNMNRTTMKKEIKYCGSTQKKITKMLLIVSTIYLCLNLPSYVMRVLTYLIKYEMFSNIDTNLFKSVQHIGIQFFNTNFGINFILYCVGGINFRKAVVATLSCRKRTQSEGGLPRGTTTTPCTLSQRSTLSYRSNRTSRKLHQLHQTISNNGQEMIVLPVLCENISKYNV